MARALSRLDQLAFADLVEKAHDAAFEAEFPANGAVLRQIRRGRAYWYYRGYERAPEARRGAQTLKYVGPAGDPGIERRVAAFANLRADYRARRELATRLRRAGLPAPLPFDGAVLAALAVAGVFRLRAVLVGSVAYQTYSGLIGVRLQGFLLAAQLAFSPAARLFAQRPLQVALHEPPLGSVDRRTAHADAGGDLFVADAASAASRICARLSLRAA
jgi:hypothetical protein